MAEKETLKRKAYCDICNVYCSSAFQLCEHVVGHKHRTNARRLSPECLLLVDKLQYFFDTYMEMDALVGLEYVEERQGQSEYHYKCQLCGFYGERKPAFLHITGPDHIAKYLNTHHPKLYVGKGRYSQKTEYLKALQQAAVEVCEKHGRKKIKEIGVDHGCGPTPPKMPKSSSASPGMNGDSHSRSLRHLEWKSGDRRKELEFKGNGDFLDYLQKFQIRSDEDARIIKQITQNCTQALVRFREEQARLNEPWGEVPGGPPTPGGSNVLNFGKVATAPQPPTDATELFFSSIKNMEESEVVGILQKIAATNAAFRGIDVPNVIKYLQATGRLKPSVAM